jgi:predicted glycogen debranching enzyme
MPLPTRTIQFKAGESLEACLEKEWLITNGIGGYASGTLAQVPTRRYHGLLVAALPAPLGRTMMLHHLKEDICFESGDRLALGGIEETNSRLDMEGLACCRQFRLEGGIPTWIFEVEGIRLEKQILMLHEQNTVHVRYRVIDGHELLRLQLRVMIQARGHDQAVDQEPAEAWALHSLQERYELIPPEGSHYPPLKLWMPGAGHAFTLAAWQSRKVHYRVEERRGYPAIGALWSPGYFSVIVGGGESATLVASTESWESVLAITPEDALESTRHRAEQLLASAPCAVLSDVAGELVLAADQFMITPVGRAEEQARARAAGDTVRTIIAGYHWFTDWGRDTMISLEGLALVNGRYAEAASILKTFAHYVKDGLIPNLFPEGQIEGLYHTADATLWFFHAVDRYLEYTRDWPLRQRLLPTLMGIYEAHVRGTRFGIGMDPADGLLRQGAEGYQLTWMDAKVEEWVVTPRRGKAVEINALWYNALRLLQEWLREDGDAERAEAVAGIAAQARRSFNERFWISEDEGLFDVVDGPDGDDAACRPNQLLAISLRHPVLSRARWQWVLDVVRNRLLTPVGLRSLDPRHPDYKAQYFGDLRARDAAYHQGTIWGWLIGPFVDAWLRMHPDQHVEARRFLSGLEEHLNAACIGNVSEIFDAEAPYHPRGCIAQAWSVAELLRAYARTHPEVQGRLFSSGPSRSTCGK